MNKYYSAEGVEGILLLYTGLDNKENAVFRIYEKDSDGIPKKNKKGCCVFKDYIIKHYDLRIKLLDGEFSETDKGNFLDYPYEYLHKEKCDVNKTAKQINDNKRESK